MSLSVCLFVCGHLREQRAISGTPSSSAMTTVRRARDDTLPILSSPLPRPRSLSLLSWYLVPSRFLNSPPTPLSLPRARTYGSTRARAHTHTWTRASAARMYTGRERVPLRRRSPFSPPRFPLFLRTLGRARTPLRTYDYPRTVRAARSTPDISDIPFTSISGRTRVPRRDYGPHARSQHGVTHEKAVLSSEQFVGGTRDASQPAVRRHCHLAAVTRATQWRELRNLPRSREIEKTKEKKKERNGRKKYESVSWDARVDDDSFFGKFTYHAVLVCHDNVLRTLEKIGDEESAGKEEY